MSKIAFTQTIFRNSTPILFPDVNPSPEATTPYPSEIYVTGQSGLISGVKITLHNVTHDFPDAVDILLQSPSGIAVAVLSDVGAAQDITDIDITISDSAATFLPDNSRIFPGSYKPTNIGTDDVWPSNTPTVNGTTMADFNGFDPNGTWKLYASSDVSGGSGAIDGGWSLTMYTTNSSMLSSSQIDVRVVPNFDDLCANISWQLNADFLPDSVIVEHSSDALTWNHITKSVRPTYAGRFFHNELAASNYYRVTVFHLRRKFVSKTVFLKRPQFVSGFHFYPNPAKRFVNVILPERRGGPCKIQLLSISGQLIKSMECPPTAMEPVRFFLNNRPGRYLLRVDLNKEQYTRTLVINP